MANNFSLRMDVSQERRPYQVGSGPSTSVRFKVITTISDIYVVDPGGAQGSVELDTELFYVNVPDLQIYEFVSGELRQYSGGSLLSQDVTFTIPVFTGGGLDDMTLEGAFNGTASYDYVVTVDDDGVTDPNTFNWTSTSGGSDTGVPMVAGTPVELEYGVTVTFAAQTGHTGGNTWEFTAYPLNVPTFIGGGLDLNDISIGTDFSGTDPKQYIVEVDSASSVDVSLFSDNGSGKLRVATASPHGLANPTDTVYILKSTAYSGTLYETIYVDPTHFDINITYSAESIVDQTVVTIKRGPISTFADNGSTKVRVTTTYPHHLANPTDSVRITSPDTFGTTVIATTYVDAFNFDLNVTYTGQVATTEYFEGVNPIKWSDDGTSWTTGVAMSTSAITLSDDFTIWFGAVIGHMVGTSWVIPKFISYEAQNEIISEADYFRFADVTDFSGSLDDPSSLSDFYKANRWVFIPSTGTGIPDKWVMREYSSTNPDGTAYTGSMIYPTKFRSSVFIADFASLDAAERHAEFVRNIINAFTKEYNALMNSTFSTYEGSHTGNVADYTFPQY